MLVITIVTLAEARVQRVFLWEDLETLHEQNEAHRSQDSAQCAELECPAQLRQRARSAAIARPPKPQCRA